jgi:hypothetical protein
VTYRIEKNKWILYRHTSNLDLITAVAVNLKNYSKTLISNEDKANLLQRLKELDSYRERNPEMPLDAINHKINTLAYYMFGYKDEIDGVERFLFSPLGNLFLKYIGDKDRINKIFLTMLWGVQYQHPHGGTHKSFQLYPFRLIFKLLADKRLENKLYAYEMASLVMFTKSINNEIYENLIADILTFRKLSNDELWKIFNANKHVLVNAAYEWDYYLSKLLKSTGLLNIVEGEVICKIQHGNTNTFRKITRNFVEINENILNYCLKLLQQYPYDTIPLRLDDSERLKIDVIKEIYSFYPKALLYEIGELKNETDEDLKSELLELPKLIEQYSNNNTGGEAYLFENVLVNGFNWFYNVEAKGIGGAGNTDIECLYITKKKKFAVDAKSTKNKLSGINAGRLAEHREKIGGEYTIVVTPRYVPAVRHDIRSMPIVIIRASTFSEYLYNCINNDVRDIDYADFDDIITDNLGNDVSQLISNLTLEKFAIHS